MAQWLRLGDSTTSSSCEIGEGRLKNDHLQDVDGKETGTDTDASIDLGHLESNASSKKEGQSGDGGRCHCEGLHRQACPFDDAACACQYGHDRPESEDIVVTKSIDIMLQKGLISSSAFGGFGKQVRTCHQSSDFYFDQGHDVVPVEPTDGISPREVAHSPEARVPLTVANLNTFTRQSFEAESTPSSFEAETPWAACLGGSEHLDDVECCTQGSSFEVLDVGGDMDETWDRAPSPTVDSSPLSLQIENHCTTDNRQWGNSEAASLLDAYTCAFVSPTPSRSRYSPSVSPSVLLAGLHATLSPRMATSHHASSYVKPIWLVPDIGQGISRGRKPQHYPCGCACRC
jgi:hypothetical protein